MSGNELYGFTDLRDDTALAVVSVAALGATLVLSLSRGRQFAAAVVASAGVAVCALAGYGALHDWRPKYGNPHITVTDVDATLVLWVSLGIGTALCLAGLILFFLLNNETGAKLQPRAGQA